MGYRRMVRCLDGHPNDPGLSFCVTCGKAVVSPRTAQGPQKLTITLADLDGDEGQGPPSRHIAMAGPVHGAQPQAPSSLPRVVRVRPVPGRASPVDGLGFELSVDGGHPIIAHTETVLARFGVVAAAWATPPGALASATTSLRLQPSFDGVGEVAVTERRLVGVIHTGTAGGSAVPQVPGGYVGWDFPLTAVAEVGLDVDQRWHGEARQIGLRVWSFEPAPAMLRLDVTSALDGRGGEVRVDDQREAMRLLVTAACDARMKDADDAERRRLVEVRAGQWVQENGAVTAEIAPLEVTGP